MLELKWWFLIGGASILFLMLVSRSFKKPLLWIWYGLLYSAVGGVVLFIINLIGEYLHLYIPINPVTAMIAGLLGIPGVAYLIAVQYFILGSGY